MSVRRGLTIALFNAWFLPMSVLITLVSFALFPLFFAVLLARLRNGRQAVLCCVRMYGRVVLATAWPFLRLRFENPSGLDRQAPGRPRRQWRPAVYVLNHGSWADAYFVSLLPFYNAAFAMRTWVFRILFYRPFMRWAGYFDAESLDWEQLLVVCRRLRDSGVGMMFFPEGHRTRDGRLQRFHANAFRLAEVLELEVIPVCIHGVYEALGHHRLLARPAVVTLRLLAPLRPADFPAEERAAALRHATRAVMERNLAEMAGQ